METARLAGRLLPCRRLRSGGMCARPGGTWLHPHCKGPTWRRPLVLPPHAVLLGTGMVGLVARPSSPVSRCERYCPWTSRATARHRTDGKRARASAPTDDPVLSRPARRNRLSLKTQDFRQQEAERPSSEPRTPLALLALPGEERPGATRRGAGDGDPGSGAGSTSGAETQTTDRQTCCLSHHSTSASLREVKWRDTLYMFQLCKGTLRAQVFAHPGTHGPEKLINAV